MTFGLLITRIIYDSLLPKILPAVLAMQAEVLTSCNVAKMSYNSAPYLTVLALL